MFYTLLSLEWKRYINDILLLWNVDKKESEEFIVLANSHHPTQPNPAKISDKEINFLDTTLSKGERFNKQAILNIGTHFFAHRNFPVHSLPATHHRLLRTNSPAKSFIENITQFKIHLCARDYPNSLVERTMSEVEFSKRKLALQQRETMQKNILPFVKTFLRTSI